MSRVLLFASASAACLPGISLAAQVPLDRADPAYLENSLPQAAPSPGAPATAGTVVDADRAGSLGGAPVAADRIRVVGNEAIPAAAFESVIQPYRGRTLSRDELRALAGAVGSAARSQGYPFARASIRQDPDQPRTLLVVLDEGHITGVRLLGVANAAVDRILQRLVGSGPVTRAALERTILLAGDVPGIRIVSSRYTQEGGFGILFVEAAETRTSAYLQLDNRGSDEIGPIRSTFLGSLRGAFSDGDELSLITAQTPFQPREFLFVRARYGAPVDAGGGIVTAAGSFGRTNPGASLRRLDVIGHSYDASVSYQRPLVRRRSGSLWGNVELRGTTSDQSLRGTPIREDRYATLAFTLIGEAKAAGGSLRGDAGLVWGLPFDGATRRGARLASRPDAGGRFVVGHAWTEWTRALVGPLSVRLAAEGQIASQPLLASMELGVGGPGFGRAYDYGERTGDQGALGSAELRVDLPTRFTGPIRALQAYAFGDGGYVDNLDEGIGGGSLASAGGGLRMTLDHFDASAEAALPISSDRLDTGDRRARFTFRLAARF